MFKRIHITAAQIRERMAGTHMPEDPLAVDLPPGNQWPGELRRKLSENLKPAGVLIPILEHPGSLTVLLTQRSDELKNHAGQVSFPGGGMEYGDVDITATALREAQEEVGISPKDVDIAGYLPPMLTVTGYAVTPVVGLVAPQVSLTLDRTEVQYTFEVPLGFVLDERNERWSERELHGVTIPVVEFNYREERIWGATAHMLTILRRLLVQ